MRRTSPNKQPRAESLYATIKEVTSELAEYGVFNYLLSNGEYLFAHCADKLCYVLRHAPFGHAHLKDQDITVDFSRLTKPNDKVAIIATLPLTDNESWTEMAPGEFLLFKDGEPLPL